MIRNIFSHPAYAIPYKQKFARYLLEEICGMLFRYFYPLTRSQK